MVGLIRSLAACALCLAISTAPADASRDGGFDPVGAWNCLIYGSYGDQRAFIGLSADGASYIARIRDAGRRQWRPMSEWRSSRGRIRFSDPDVGREFTAEAGRSSLGGTWRSPVGTGGWWCTPVDGAQAVTADSRPPSPAGLMIELFPAIMASPNYPRQAIREAKEGRAVSCFPVYGSGEIGDAELVELSDEIFRAPTLAAVAQSRYREWGDVDDVRPACRSFTFELDTIR